MTSSQANSDRLLNAQDVARLLGVSKAWVYEQSRRGQIPTVRLGRYRRYRRDAIESWILELEAGKLEAPRGTEAMADRP